MEKIPLISVRNLHKKFSKDIKYNLHYGVQDILRRAIGKQPDYLTLRKKEFWTLKNVNFDLYEGEILSILGTNGSGKTTLIRIISNIYATEQGQVYGRPNLKITSVFALAKGMQPLFTGRENIYIKGAMYGMTKAEIDAKMSFIEAFSELGDKLDRPFGNYSSGMRARLAYSIAIATEPNIFIIDEALAVGDSFFKTKCFEHLKEYVKQPERAVLFVTHHIRKVLKVATRVLVMKDGEFIYNSTDIKEALNYYIYECMEDLEEDQKQLKLKKVQDYELY